MSENPPPIALGVYGIGEHARRTVLPAIACCTQVRLAGIATRNLDVLDVESRKYGCPSWTTLNNMLAETSLDVIMIATPIGQHFEDAHLVLSAGKHVWCEKAFTESYTQAEELIAIARRTDLAVCVSCPPLYHEQFRKLAALVRNGRIGQVRSINANYGFPHIDPNNSKYDPNIGGGAMLDVGFYPIGVPGALFDESPVVLGSAIEHESGYDLDTGGAALLRFPSGINLSATWGYGRDYVNELQIVGTSGIITAFPAFSKPSALKASLTLRNQNKTKDIYVPTCNQFTNMLNAFANAIFDMGARERFRTNALKHQGLMDAVRKIQVQN